MLKLGVSLTEQRESPASLLDWLLQIENVVNRVEATDDAD